MFSVNIYDITEWWTLAIGFQIFVGALLYMWNQKRVRPARESNQDNFAKAFAEWNPAPLIEEDVSLEEPFVMGTAEESCLNMGATSFLSLDKEAGVRAAAVAAVRKYGVGSCGPRGFYGTIDVHLQLEERLAGFLRVEETCVYSYGFATVSSAISAYAKRGDIVFADEAVHFAIQKGFDASRCTVVYFRHNDVAHLEELLAAAQDKKQLNSKRRAFIVLEAIYFNTGKICPLKRAVELARKYKLRMILDESLTIGVLGKHGRGLTEHLNIPIEEVDLIVGSLENSLGSVGGFCAGSHFIVEHQRLSGVGYCFSASLPPLLTQAAISALDNLEERPEMLTRLEVNSVKLHKALSGLTGFTVEGHEISPIKHVRLARADLTDRLKQSYLQHMAAFCLRRGVALAVAAYLRDAEVNCPEPSIRIASNADLRDRDILNVCNLMQAAYDNVIPKEDLKPVLH